MATANTTTATIITPFTSKNSAAFPSIELIPDISVLNNNSSQSHSFPPLLNDLILRAALGQSTDRVPIWCHRQAGRYLPEFKLTRTVADFFTVCQTPELASEVSLQPLRRFQLDACIIFSDILVIPQSLGLIVEMRAGIGPVLPEPLINPESLSRLRTVELALKSIELTTVYQAITVTRYALKGIVPLIGFCGAPFTLMCYMTEGGSSKSYDRCRSWFYKWPESTIQLLQLLTNTAIQYLLGQINAGAQMLEIFDSWCGVLPIQLFQKYILPNYIQISTVIKSKYPSIPITIFPKGVNNTGLKLIAQYTLFDCISIDWSTEPKIAREMIELGLKQRTSSNSTSNRSTLTLQGNLDVSALYAPESVLRTEIRSMIDSFGTNNYIANLGHGMLPDHKPEQLEIFVNEVHQYSELINKQQQQQQ